MVWVTLQNFAPVLGRSWQGRWADPASPPASISKFCWEALCHPGGGGGKLRVRESQWGCWSEGPHRGEERKDRVLVYLVCIYLFILIFELFNQRVRR